MTDQMNGIGQVDALLEGIEAELLRRQQQVTTHMRRVSSPVGSRDRDATEKRLRSLVELVETLVADGSEALAAEILERSSSRSSRRGFSTAR